MTLMLMLTSLCQLPGCFCSPDDFRSKGPVSAFLRVILQLFIVNKSQAILYLGPRRPDGDVVSSALNATVRRFTLQPMIAWKFHIHIQFLKGA